MSAIPYAIENLLWVPFKRHEPSARLGGILADKRGYHNSRNRLLSYRAKDGSYPWRNDYSVVQFAVDREGDGDYASAIDITFPDAQDGDYKTIKKYSARLLAAGKAGRARDPRTIYMREFFGNVDDDREVEGWDFARGRASTSDSSHLWHIHISIHRKYANDAKAMAAILSILIGETVEEWLGQVADAQAVWNERIVSPGLNHSAVAADWLKEYLSAHRELAALRADIRADRAQ